MRVIRWSVVAFIATLYLGANLAATTPSNQGVTATATTRSARGSPAYLWILRDHSNAETYRPVNSERIGPCMETLRISPSTVRRLDRAG